MKFIKFLSLITIIIYAPTSYSMEDNTLQEQSRVPKLVDLCRPRAIEQINAHMNQQYAKPNTYEEAVRRLNEFNTKCPIANLGLADELYKSNELFQHCIDFIINEIWNQCQRVTGTTLDAIMHEIRQNLLSKIPSENLLSFIEAHFCKQKGWHVPHCLKKFNNVSRDEVKVNFSPDNLLKFVEYKYRYRREELLCTGNFEQIIFKRALKNTLQKYKDQQSTDIKGLTVLLNHQILTTFPQQAQGQLSKDMGLNFKGLAGILLNNPQQKRIVKRT